MYASPTCSTVQVMNPLQYPSTRCLATQHGCSHHSSSSNNKSHTTLLRKRRQSISSIKALDGVSTVISDPAQAEITWQIVIGALAGVTPFVVAGIEFSKRIVAQRKCEVCKGSGLVLRDSKYYFRCPRCGGFLPWQSWRRFFTG